MSQGANLLDAGAGNRQNCSHLNYVSQDFCQYNGAGGPDKGMQFHNWYTTLIDLLSDITAKPTPDASFNVIFCSEVLVHVPRSTHALDEFARLLKADGVIILIAPFASKVHMAPCQYFRGFFSYLYEYCLLQRGFHIRSLDANGDWCPLLLQEITRLGDIER